VPFSLYLVASGISSLLWGAGFTLLGFALGRTALPALMFTQRLDVRLALVAIVLTIVLAVMVRRRRANARGVRVPVPVDDARGRAVVAGD
jgi:membrane protein DedA with SNARE-associated domain